MIAHPLDELLAQTGFLLRRDALAMGYDDRELARHVRAAGLLRIRQGVYVNAERWRSADLVECHQLLCAAIMRLYDDHVALSHDSAVLGFGGPNWRLHLDHVHLTHLRGGGRITAKVAHHNGAIRVDDLTRRNGAWITTPGRTALDVTATRGLEVGLVVTNDFLHRQLTTKADLRARQRQMSKWPGHLHTQLLISLADERIESVGESRVFYLCWLHGIPRLEPQWVVTDKAGRPIARVDFAWPEYGVLLEFDGAIKYGRRMLGTDDPRAVSRQLVADKRREDQIRELTGFEVIRLTWQDLRNQQQTAGRILAALHRRSAA